MNAYNIYTNGKWALHCQGCADTFFDNGGDYNDLGGPYADGGGKADFIRHCSSGGKCINAIQTRSGPKGACFHNRLTLKGIVHTIDALEGYVENGDGIQKVLDMWADELYSYSLNRTQENVLYKYTRIRARGKINFNAIVDKIPDNQLVPPKSKKKQDTKMDSLTAFFDGRPAMNKAICCKSCKDTGIIMLFNSSVKCVDCRDV